MDGETVGLLFGLCVGIIFWFICGYIGGKIGASRGRERAGFWVGFLLGPLGCVVALFLPREGGSEFRGQRSNVSGGIPAKTCSLCGKRADLYARACPDCSNPL